MLKLTVLVSLSVFLVSCAQPGVHAGDIPLQEDTQEKTADAVMGSAAGWTVRMDIDGYFPAEDVLVSTKSTDFWKQGPGAFITKPPYLNGKERQKYHRVYIFPTGEDWTEHKVTIVPDASGKLTLTCYAVAPGSLNIVHWDDVRAEGATLKNGGFERLDDEGVPAGWKLGGWTTRAPKGRLITAEGAAEGKRYVMSSWTWHWSATMTDVVKDRPIVLRWKNRFVPPETRYPVRVGINGLGGRDPAKHTTFELAGGMRTKAEAPERYVGRLLDGFDAAKRYGGGRAVNKALGIYLGQAGEKWVERTVRIKPKTDGKIVITLHGPRIRETDRDVYKPVWVDYREIRVEGAKLSNPELKDADADGLPDRWRRIGADEDFRILRSEDGQTLARTWYQAGIRQTLTDVKAGREILIHMKVRAPKMPDGE